MISKYKLIVSGLLIFNILSMFFSWFGGAEGVQEIKGTLVLLNPITIICIGIVFVGLWANIKKFGKAITVAGLSGIALMEIYYFLTWYIGTINDKFSLLTCFELTYPGFYLGLGLSVISLILYVAFSKSNISVK